ncbi:MAG: hypothetical protein OZ921_08810 [Sorangiineae bacterium]|nr:hypothetical protein [Polyangiaceae bacterium]MEB2322601.1 hypothetical protein [Sorangiineae bacterium]
MFAEPTRTPTPQLRWLMVALAAWASLSWPAMALAEDARPIRVRLHWRNDTSVADCLDEAALARGVEVRLQRPAFVQDAYDLQLDGGVVNERGARVARITLRKADGTLVGKRELESRDPTCRTLDEAVPLSVALMIDYQQRVSRLHVPALPPPAPKPPPPRPAPRPAAAPSEPTTPRWQLGTRVGGGVDAGALPGATWLALAGIELTRGWSMLRADGVFFAPKTATLGPGRVFVTGWGVGASACAVWRHATDVHTAYCLGAEAGRLYLAGSRFMHDSDAVATHARAWGGAEARLRLVGPWWAGVGAQLGTPLVAQRWEFTDERGDPSPLYSSSRVVGRLLLTLGYAR